MTPANPFHAWQLERARDLAPADWRLLPARGCGLGVCNFAKTAGANTPDWRREALHLLHLLFQRFRHE